MLELVILKGLPASGKSTWARSWVNEEPKGRVIVNRDNIRRMLGPYWVPTRENLVTEIEDSMIMDALMARFDVVVDATNLKGTERFENLIEKYNLKSIVTLSVKDFTDVDIEICLERDKLREKDEQVGEDVIRRMAKNIKK